MAARIRFVLSLCAYERCLLDLLSQMSPDLWQLASTSVDSLTIDSVYKTFLRWYWSSQISTELKYELKGSNFRVFHKGDPARAYLSVMNYVKTLPLQDRALNDRGTMRLALIEADNKEFLSCLKQHDTISFVIVPSDADLHYWAFVQKLLQRLQDKACATDIVQTYRYGNYSTYIYSYAPTQWVVFI